MTTLTIPMKPYEARQRNKLVNEIRTNGFSYNATTELWSKAVCKAQAEYWLKQLRRAGVEATFLESDDSCECEVKAND